GWVSIVDTGGAGNARSSSVVAPPCEEHRVAARPEQQKATGALCSLQPGWALAGTLRANITCSRAFSLRFAMTSSRIDLLPELLERRILLLDGAMGTMIQSYQLSEEDYRGERFARYGREVRGNNDLL